MAADGDGSSGKDSGKRQDADEGQEEAVGSEGAEIPITEPLPCGHPYDPSTSYPLFLLLLLQEANPLLGTGGQGSEFCP